MELICLSSLKLLSKIKPRFLTEEQMLEFRVPRESEGSEGGGSKIMISVLFSFRVRKLESIQDLTSFMQLRSGLNGSLDVFFRGR